MKRKPTKVEEPQSPYPAKKPVVRSAAASKDSQVRYIDREIARKLTKDILDKHHDLFRKLAQ